MKPIINAGIILGVAVGIWMFINGAAGLYKSPGTGWVFPVGATIIEIAVIVWGLKKTAQLGRQYGGQIVAGLLIAVIGALIIIPCSLAWSAVFPDASEIGLAIQADKLADRGMEEEQIEQSLAVMEKLSTPLVSAIMGSIMCILTGLVTTLIAAFFIRHKEA
jgi:hypothetical protein